MMSKMQNCIHRQIYSSSTWVQLRETQTQISFAWLYAANKELEDAWFYSHATTLYDSGPHTISSSGYSEFSEDGWESDRSWHLRYVLYNSRTPASYSPSSLESS